jgi:hypothetical protein
VDARGNARGNAYVNTDADADADADANPDADAIARNGGEESGVGCTTGEGTDELGGGAEVEEKRGGQCEGDESAMSIDEAVDDDEHADEVDVDDVRDFLSRSRSSRQNIWPFLRVAMNASATAPNCGCLMKS